MASRAHSYPQVRTPFEYDDRVRVPGRGRILSLLLALVAVVLLLMVGTVMVLTYLASTEDAATGTGDEPYILYPSMEPEADRIPGR